MRKLYAAILALLLAIGAGGTVFAATQAPPLSSSAASTSPSLAAKKPQTINPDCQVCTQYTTSPSYEDWACYAIASAPCAIANLSPAARAACLAAAYGACYVWGTTYCSNWVWQPCPQ